MDIVPPSVVRFWKMRGKPQRAVRNGSYREDKSGVKMKIKEKGGKR